jgi:hypothetical protein
MSYILFSAKKYPCNIGIEFFTAKSNWLDMNNYVNITVSLYNLMG